MKTIAYLRVSTFDQNTEKFYPEIIKFCKDKKLGNPEFVEETISTKVGWKKTKVQDIVNELKKGDSLVVPELSRLGRTMLDIMELLSIFHRNGVSLYSIKEKWELCDSPHSLIMATHYSHFAQAERDLNNRRTKEALAALRLKGIKLGRPKGPGKSKLDQYEDDIFALLENGSSKRFISKRYNLNYNTLNVWHKKKLKMRKESKNELG